MDDDDGWMDVSKLPDESSMKCELAINGNSVIFVFLYGKKRESFIY